MTLRTRIALAVAAAVALVSVVLAVGVFWLAYNEIRTNQDLALQRESGRVLQIYYATGSLDEPEDCEWLTSPACAVIIGPDGKQENVAGPGPTMVLNDQIRDAARGTSPRFLNTESSDGTTLRVYVRQLPGERALAVGMRDDRVQKSVERLAWFLTFLCLGATVAGAGAGYLLARQGMKPIQRLTQNAQEVARTKDPTAIIDVTRKDEVGQLALAFASMLGELKQSQEQQKHLVADASHELRTPLTSLRSNISLLRQRPQFDDDIFTTIDREVLSMQSTVEDIIDLARGEESLFFTEGILLTELVRHCFELARQRFPEIHWSLEILPEAESFDVDGDRALLSRAIGNMLENAGKFTPDNGQVNVRVQLADDALRVTVSDTGPGIPPEDLERVFQRFYRAPAARNTVGSGLGLAMVKATALLHHGQVQAFSNVSGSTFVMTIPPILRSDMH